MAGTRSSARQAAQKNNDASPKTTEKTSSGSTKRKAVSPADGAKKKRGRPSKAAKEQKTLEETVPGNDGEEGQQNEGQPKTHAGDANEEGEESSEAKHSDNGDESAAKTTGDSSQVETQEEGESGQKGLEDASKDSRNGEGMNALDQVKADENQPGKTSKIAQDSEEKHSDDPAINGGTNAEPAVEEEKPREQAQPENVMEKGIIYFFARGRVGMDDPGNASEIQRSYMVLRPLPPGAKITEGAIQDVSNNRLVALPKKVWPKSGRDRFIVFVEKASTSMETLKDEFFQGSEYSTKTTGTRHTPPVTPIGEGVYAISYSGQGRAATHLSYMMTIPQEIGDVQKDVGLREQGSFILSTKNPNSSAPANAIPAAPEYPKDILDEFGSRGWLPTKPQHLDYANACTLLIGESSALDALEAKPQDAQDENKETPVEEIEKLEHEDEIRIEHMKGDDTVYADLGISKKDYPTVKSTW
ncbi:hypothetical protein D0865_11109 [Hortaea werneckii]|uniref:BTB domain transcription factor n=1 Tax=Hortaea werneckii TaxID=91943 RepID=A0A3M7BUZ5_HORWE|nr:hypothetical protein D0865_11109 [Hortaea werneckii]